MGPKLESKRILGFLKSNLNSHKKTQYKKGKKQL